MTSAPASSLLLSVRHLSGDVLGDEFALETREALPDSPIPFHIEVTEGRGRWTIEGRRARSEASWEILERGYGSAEARVPQCRRYRVRWSDAQRVTADARLDAPVRRVG